MPLTPRTVAVEFLRSGPRHNQLLSPLTPYLAVCGDSPAGVVHVPYEQAMFERLRGDLRYAVTTDDEQNRLRGVLDQTGREVARMLADVPGLPGALSERRDTSEILHLRIVLSASELALIPFELSKVPIGSGATSDNWLALQAFAPVCITRHNRSVRSEGVKWPTRPKILFVSGAEVPFEEHRDALSKALEPWVGNDIPLDSWLTVLPNASLEEVMNATGSAEYTHVHILAHGAPFTETKREAFGVSLKGGVVSGRELAAALFSISPEKIHQPTVVTLATCDSGGGGSVINAPDVSVAHDLHEAGIPLVVASQFPLSTSGSIPFVREFYSDQLRGYHPLLSLYRVRLILHASYSQHYHDWASLVVYEALPANLEEQLYDLRYNQMRAVLEGALTSIESATSQPESQLSQDQYKAFVDKICTGRKNLPDRGPYAAECVGLRASSWKRLAQVEYRLAKAANGTGRQRRAEICFSNLESALSDYRAAANAFLVNSKEPVHRKATLHWLLGQVLSMECVLGRPFQSDLWMVAYFSAKTELDQPDPEARIWGHGTISELWLLKLADPSLSDQEAAEAAREATDHARQLLALNGLMSPPVFSTSRQVERYINWWSQPDFATMLETFRVRSKDFWHRKNGLIETARQLVEILGQRRPAIVATDAPAAAPPKPSSKPAPAPDLQALKPRQARVVGDRPAGSGGVFNIEMIPAENGDCLWIEYGEPKSPRRLLIDCGAKSAAKILAAKVQDLENKARAFELFVLTHIDADHISGVLPFFEKPPDGISFNEIWFNGWKQLPREDLGVRQGEEFSELLSVPALKPSWNRSFTQNGADPAAVMLPESGQLPSVTLADGMKLTILSPGRPQLADLARNWLKGLLELHPDKTKEELLAHKAPPPKVTDFEHFDVKVLADKKAPLDKSVANGSSIALLLEFDGKAALLTGDAHAEVMAESIRRLMTERGTPDAKLRLDAMKLSHHGSTNALTKELLGVIECPKYLVSTDGTKFYHPDRDAIARVIQYGGTGPLLHFNYLSELNEMWGNEVLQKRFDYRTKYAPKEQPGLRVSL